MGRRPPVRAAAAFALALLGLEAAAAAATTIDGTVFVDDNDNGVLDAGEATLAGVAVFFENSMSVKTDDTGRYRLALTTGGIIWVRIPDGFRPTPVWRLIIVQNGNK